MENKSVMCINVDVPEDSPQWPLDLTFGKVYRVLPPEPLDTPDVLRVVDDSGEDYLYSAKRFEPVKLTEAGQQALERVPV